MKIKYLGEDSPGYFIKNKTYDVIGKEKGFGNKYLYRVIDESGEDYLYELEDKTKFKIIDE